MSECSQMSPCGQVIMLPLQGSDRGAGQVQEEVPGQDPEAGAADAGAARPRPRHPLQPAQPRVRAPRPAHLLTVITCTWGDSEPGSPEIP